MGISAKENGVHVTKGEAAWVTFCGILMALGIIFPPLGGIGLTGASLGALRVIGREQDWKLHKLTSYISEAFNRGQNPQQ